jgi:uncharacterized protein
VTTVKTRRLSFPFSEKPRRKYFAGDNIVLSHLMAAMSGLFPGGEDYFVRSVHRFVDQITDPELKEQVKGFCGQESTHALHHRKLNDTLTADGYLIQRLDSDLEKRPTPFPESFEQRLSPIVHLAITAAMEHFTAVLAERMLGREQMQAMAMDAEIRNLMNWHALEEIEHKSVCFDVFRAMGGTEFTRISSMAFVGPVWLTVAAVVVGASLACDAGARRQPWRVAKEIYGLIRGPLFKGLIGDAFRYMRPGFHPDDIDDTALLGEWRHRLFDAGGSMAGHLK